MLTTKKSVGLNDVAAIKALAKKRDEVDEEAERERQRETKIEERANHKGQIQMVRRIYTYSQRKNER